MNTRLTPVFTLLTVAALATSASCFAAEKFTFLTNWYAQAEHGGFYQAQATGLYQHAGLDVEIKMGGPQINVMQLMAAGQADCTLGDNGQALETWQAGVHAVTVATVFQHSPTVFITHDKVENPAELKAKPSCSPPRPIPPSGRGRKASWVWLAAKCAPIPLTFSRSSPIKTWCSRAT